MAKPTDDVPARGHREVETGAGAYRRGSVTVPIPPRLSRTAVSAAASLGLALVSLAILGFELSLRSEARPEAPGLWQALLLPSVVMVPTGLALALILGSIARRRIAEHPELRGATLVEVVRRSAGSCLGLLGCVTVLLGAALGLAWWFFKDYNMGRPLRSRGKALTARPRLRAGSKPQMAPPTNLVTRWALAAIWGRAASLEHAAVAAFEQLREQLVALGAPADLVARMERARSEEAVHARLCLRLAERWTGWPLAPGRLPPIERTPPALDRLAAEQVRDGCLMEGYAAAMAAEGARTARDAEARPALEVIARDEARHAEDAYAVLQWLLRVGGDPVSRAVEQALACLPERAPQVGPRWSRALDLSPYGFPGGPTADRLFAAARAEATARVGSMLGRRRAA